MDSVRVGWANHFRRETSSITRSPAPESVMLDEHQHSAHQATHGHNHRYPARTQLDLSNQSAKTLQSAKIKRHMLNVTRRTVTRQKHSDTAHLPPTYAWAIMAEFVPFPNNKSSMTLNNTITADRHNRSNGGRQLTDRARPRLIALSPSPLSSFPLFLLLSLPPMRVQKRSRAAVWRGAGANCGRSSLQQPHSEKTDAQRSIAWSWRSQAALRPAFLRKNAQVSN